VIAYDPTHASATAPQAKQKRRTVAQDKQSDNHDLRPVHKAPSSPMHRVNGVAAGLCVDSVVFRRAEARFPPAGVRARPGRVALESLVEIGVSRIEGKGLSQFSLRKRDEKRKKLGVA